MICIKVINMHCELLDLENNNLDYVVKYNEYNLLLKFNYNVQQLKLFANYYISLYAILQPL